MAKTKASTPGLRLEYMDPAQLHENPLNWRLHPTLQQEALQAMIDEVGWAGAALYNEATGHLIDGHLRKKVGKGKIPVLIGHWTLEQERKILATLDPLTGMAQIEATKLKELLDSFQADGVVETLLKKLAYDAGIAPPDFMPSPLDEQGRLDEKAKVTCPQCGTQFSP
jgi:hypothetical protein